MRRSGPRTHPLRQCHRHDCAGTSSSPATADLSCAPYTWQRWLARPGLRYRMLFQAKIIQCRFPNRPRGQNYPFQGFGHCVSSAYRHLVTHRQGKAANVPRASDALCSAISKIASGVGFLVLHGCTPRLTRRLNWFQGLNRAPLEPGRPSTGSAAR